MLVNFALLSTDYTAPLCFELYHNKQLVYSCSPVTKPVDVSLILVENPNDNDEAQELCWTMSGKTTEHTTVDADGNILNDAALITKNFKLDNFELGNLLVDNCVYLHNHNGSTKDVIDSYYDYMGCNGKVIFKFTAPAYIWLLKNY
jgi:hypothetical protein